MTDYFYGESGNNGNNGLTYANRKLTFAAAAALSGPGDTVFICSSTGGGGSWTQTEQIVIVSGSSGGGMWTLKVRSGDDILLDVNTGSGAIQGDNKSYFQIEPGDGTLTCGDLTDWSVANYDGYTASEQLQLNNCHHFKLIGTGTGVVATTDSNFLIHGGSRYSQNSIDTDCNLGLLYGIDWHRHGSNDTGTAEWGDQHRNFGTKCVYEKCTWREGGHNQLLFFGQELVCRDSESDADWTAHATGSDGTRCAIFVGGDTSNGGADPFGPQLVEGNIFPNCAGSGNNSNNPCLKTGTNHLILRRNYIWDGIARVQQARTNADFDQGGSSLGTATRLKRYHNTVYKVGAFGDDRQTGSGNSDMFHRGDILNSIFDLMTENPSASFYYRDADGDGTEGHPDSWKSGRVMGNCLNNDTNPENMKFDPDGGAEENFEIIADGPTNYPNVFSDNTDTRPTYAGDPDSGDRTKADFAPNGGSAEDQAVPLAYVDSADTSSGTSLILQDGEADQFYDGWGMEWLGEDEKRDYLKIVPAGSDPRTTGDIVRVAYDGINYATDTITLDAGVSRSDGDEIWGVLPDGVTVMTDAGAGQTAMPAGGGLIIPAYHHYHHNLDIG